MRFSLLSDQTAWKPAIEHYFWDRMEDAFLLAKELGIGVAGGYLAWYRMIEAEYRTRIASDQVEILPQLQVEGVADEVDDVASLAESIAEICDDMAARFEWEQGPKTLVSVMATETDAPWTLGRFGFCVDKHPYEKICIPNSCIWDRKQLESTVAHEYAHVMSLNLANGRVPRWLDEAVAVTAGGDLHPRSRREFVVAKWPWRSPYDLQRAFATDQREEGGQSSLWIAYQQSGCIGEYLASLNGESGMTDLLRAFSNNSMWTELKISAGFEQPTDEALKEVFGLDTHRLFQLALEYAAR